jgi:hypothetical protein
MDVGRGSGLVGEGVGTERVMWVNMTRVQYIMYENVMVTPTKTYKSVTYFCMLILYPVTLLNLFIWSLGAKFFLSYLFYFLLFVYFGGVFKVVSI